MKCPKCGKENSNDAKFCYTCGVDLSQKDSPKCGIIGVVALLIKQIISPVVYIIKQVVKLITHVVKYIINIIKS